MRFSRILFLATAAVVGALVIVACGSSNTSNDRHVTVTVFRTQTVTTPPPAPTTATTPPLTPTTATKTTTTAIAPGTACKASDLTPTFLGSNGAAGTIELGFGLKNTGSTTCHTYGWPGVELLSSNGVGLPTNATRTTTDVLGDTPANVLTLKPGEQASFRLIASDFAAGGGSCDNASQLQIYAPDDTVTMKVAISGGVPACGRATLSPMMPGASAFSQ
jgi:hypothetical protein